MFTSLDRTVFDAVAEPLLVVSLAGAVAAANGAAKRMLGLSGTPPLSGSVDEFFIRRGGDLASYLRLCAASRTALPTSLTRRDAAGDEAVSCLGRACRVGQEDDSPLVLLQLRSVSDTRKRLSELTELRRAESQRQRRILRLRLHQSERLAAAVIRHAPDAFVRVGPEGLVQDWNPEAERMFGWRREEVVDLPLPAILRNADDVWMASPAETGPGAQQTTARRLSATGVSRAGQSQPIEITLIRLPVPGGDTTCLFLRDMTALVESQAQLLQAQKAQVLGALTGGIAHDFNNLLTVVLGSAELLSMRPDLDEKARQMVANILLSAQKGAELTHRLLAFARRQPLQPAPTDLADLVDQMVPLLQTSVGERVRVEALADPGLPLAMADPAQIESALVNLVLNARDALPNGGRIVIECTATAIDEAYANRFEELSAGDYIVLSVSDNGTGMPPEVLKRATEPFFTTKDVGKGSGLGLSMIFGFAKQSGGHLNIYSELGHGTTVKLYLPQANGTDEAAAPAPLATAMAPGGSETLLIVEDEILVREQAAAILGELGYEVLTARDGEEGLRTARERADLALVLLDVVLPGRLNGRQCAEAIVRHNPRVKILYTSGYTENAIVHQGRLDPGIELLTKPYRAADLASRVRRLLDEG